MIKTRLGKTYTSHDDFVLNAEIGDSYDEHDYQTLEKKTTTLINYRVTQHERFRKGKPSGELIIMGSGTYKHLDSLNTPTRGNSIMLGGVADNHITIIDSTIHDARQDQQVTVKEKPTLWLRLRRLFDHIGK